MIGRVPLGEVCAFINGGTPSKSVGHYFSGDIPWITGADITGPMVSEARSFITAEAVARSATNRVPKGTVLLVTRTSVGKVAIAGRALCFSQDITALITNASRLDAAFLVHFLRTQQDHFEREARGATIKGITRSVVADARIPLPSLCEQRRIAAILDQAETLRAQRRAAIAQLDSLGQAVFLEMFGEPARNPKQWSKVKLGDLAVNGFQNGLYKHSSDYGSGTPILRIDAFYDGKVTKLDALKRVRVSETEARIYGLHAQDIVINRVNSIEYLGKSALIPALSEPVVFESNMMRFTTDASVALPGYVIACLQDVSIKVQIAASAKQAVNQASINQKDVAAFQICVPPVPMQDNFVRRIQAVDHLKSTHRAALARLDELFASLQHRAFRGEL